MSDSLQPHESQHARPPCPSPTPGVHSDSCPLTQWRHPAISSSVSPFSSCPQSLPASEYFPMSQCRGPASVESRGSVESWCLAYQVSSTWPCHEWDLLCWLPASQHFTWGGQSTGASALASFLPKKSRADLLNQLPFVDFSRSSLGMSFIMVKLGRTVLLTKCSQQAQFECSSSLLGKFCGQSERILENSMVALEADRSRL